MIGPAWMTYKMKSRRNVPTEKRRPLGNGEGALKMMALGTRATVCSDTFCGCLAGYWR